LRWQTDLMIRFSSILVLLSLTLASLRAHQETNDIALTVEGFEIPIQILTPDRGSGPFPVVYHVHGGGWNGGTATEVPGTGIPPESKILCDELGIIYVGLAYRCKAQGTFQNALDDLRASIAWFQARADVFQADLTRVGLSGGSAGTPLSALLAQEMESCRTYVGFFGVYDLLNNEESLFPNEEACEQYGLATSDAKLKASAYHNLRPQPPATLLFHGGKDILTSPAQSTRFAERLRAQGASVEAVIYSDVNHGYFNPRNPREFKDTTLRIARLYAQHLKETPFEPASLSARLEEMLDRYLPLDAIPEREVTGTWKGTSGSLRFFEGGSGTMTHRNGRRQAFTYRVSGGSIGVTMDNVTTQYFMQKDRRAIYRIPSEGRYAGRKEHFSK
jgi:acetyl esterase/lipase